MLTIPTGNFVIAYLFAFFSEYSYIIFYYLVFYLIIVLFFL